MNPPAKQAVRLATPDDSSVLARLRYAFRVEHHEVVESEPDFVARCATWMRSRIGPTSRWRVWLLTQDDAVVGTLWVQIVEKLPNPGREPELHAYFSSFYIVPAARNAGGGTHLLRAALDECRSFHVDSVFLWPSARSRPLYERHGFRVTDAVLVNQLQL